MTIDISAVARQLEQTATELIQTSRLRAGQVIVMGVSTSEIQGHRIGTSGTITVAEQIYKGVITALGQSGIHTVWQCCEHLNRALVADRRLAEAQGWLEVSAVPIPTAGGSMAAYAYRQLEDPCLVEAVQVHAGIDIGETMIGMHLRPVAIPIRPSHRFIGEARVSMAMTRPRLIGGSRAAYSLADSPHHDSMNSAREERVDTCD